MSNPILDLSIAVTLTALAVLGTMTVMPRPKPEPPPTTEPVCELNKECPPLATVRAEPKTEDERLHEVEQELADAAKEQKKLAEQLKAIIVARGQRDE